MRGAEVVFVVLNAAGTCWGSGLVLVEGGFRTMDGVRTWGFAVAFLAALAAAGMG